MIKEKGTVKNIVKIKVTDIHGKNENIFLCYDGVNLLMGVSETFIGGTTLSTKVSEYWDFLNLNQGSIRHNCKSNGYRTIFYQDEIVSEYYKKNINLTKEQMKIFVTLVLNYVELYVK